MNAPIDMATLVRLADKDIEQQVADFGGLPLDIQTSLNRQMTERRTKVVDEAAGEIVNLLATKDAFLTSNAATIATLESQIAGLKDMMAGVKRATQYGLASQNFLPLAKSLGMGVPRDTKADLQKVPADFVAPEVVAEVAPAAPVSA
jgi:hypothetical protein